MPVNVDEIRGLRATQQKLEQVVRDLAGDEFLQGMREAVLIVARDAKRNAPVDTGRLRASITPAVTRSGTYILGVVGSNVQYAPAVEYGTPPHHVPVEQLEGWARRKGMDAEAVAAGIAKYGTPAQSYLISAFDDNKPAIIAKLNDVVGRIVER